MSGNTATVSFTDSDCDSTFYFRVYWNGTVNYSNVLTVTTTSTGSGQRLASNQESQSGIESVSETSTGTEPSATDSGAPEPNATDSSTPEPSATETAGDAPSPEHTNQ